MQLRVLGQDFQPGGRGSSFAWLRHIKFAGVPDGSFWLWVDDGTPPVRFEAGDFFLLTWADLMRWKRPDA